MNKLTPIIARNKINVAKIKQHNVLNSFDRSWSFT